MSVTASRGASTTALDARLVVMALSLAIVAGAILLLGSLIASQAAPPPPPARNPFGVGPREAVPAATGLSGLITLWQSSFYRELTAALRAFRDSSSALPLLLWLGFAYGVFHAAGPGHGKAVISAYIVSDDRSAAMRGIGLSFAAAMLQALVAIALVATLFVLMGMTARQMNLTTRWIELASFALVMLAGLVVLWSKAGLLVAARAGDPMACAPGCAHDVASAMPQTRSWREASLVVLAAGIRPCAGAIILLTLAMSQGLIMAGIAATFAMAVGTALTTGALALIAVGAKRLALRFASGRGNRAALAIRALECLAAAVLAAFGAMLLFGVWTASAS